MRRISSAVVMLIAVVSVPAQSQSGSQSVPSPVTLRVEVPVVALQGTGAVDLCSRPFRVIENGKRQSVVSCGADSRPLSIGVLVDGSPSMRQYASLVREILTAILSPDFASGEEHLFMSEATLRKVVPPPGFRGSRVDLLSSVERRGRTAIVDHLHAAALELAKGTGNRGVLIVLSDGDDNLSESSDKKLIGTLQQTRVTLLYVLLYNPRNTLQAELPTSKIMMDLAGGTGGVLLPVRDSKDCTRATQTLSSVLNTATLVTYNSSNPTLDGSYRKIKLESNKEPGRPPLRLHYRQGYYAPNQ